MTTNARPNTALDVALSVVPEETRERVLRVAAAMGVGASDPAFAWAIAAGHIHQAIDELPTAMRKAADDNLSALEQIFSQGHQRLAAETSDHLRTDLDRSVANHIELLRNLLTDAVRSECKRIDTAGGALELLLSTSSSRLQDAVKVVEKLPENLADEVIKSALIERLPVAIEHAVRDRLVKQERNRKTFAVGLVGAIVLASVVLGAAGAWALTSKLYEAKFEAQQSREEASASQRLGDAREILLEARPLYESLRDPVKRARLEWAQANPNVIDIVRSEAGKQLMRLADGYKGSLDIRAPYPCITMGARTQINGTIVNRTCTVALSNE